MFAEAETKHILKVKDKIKKKLHDINGDVGFNKLSTNWTGDAYLTGGAIASLIQDEEPKDWDIYFKSRETQLWFATSYNRFEDGIKEVDEKYAQFLGENGKHVTAQAITMKNGISFIIMNGMYGNPKDVRKSFDYVHCTPWYDLLNDKLHVSELQYRACKQKRLVLNNLSAWKSYRESKFLDRGYT